MTLVQIDGATPHEVSPVTAADIETLSPALRRWLARKAHQGTAEGIAAHVNRDMEWQASRDKQTRDQQLRYSRQCLKDHRNGCKSRMYDGTPAQKCLEHLGLAEAYGPLSKQQRAEAANMRKELGV